MKKFVFALVLAWFFCVSAYAVTIPIQIGRNGPVIYIPVGDPTISSGQGQLTQTEGTIIGTSGNTILIRTTSGYDRTIYLTDQTRITGSLQIGSHVNVTGRSYNGSLFADSITVSGYNGYPGENHIRGTIVSNVGNQIVLRTTRGVTQTIYLTDQTRVNSALRDGLVVYVTGYYLDGVFYANTINAFGQSLGVGNFHVQGTLDSLIGNILSVRNSHGLIKTVYLTDQTQIHGSLQIGSHVSISGYTSNGSFFANNIRVSGNSVSRHKEKEDKHDNGEHRGWHKDHNEENENKNE